MCPSVFNNFNYTVYDLKVSMLSTSKKSQVKRTFKKFTKYALSNN